MTNERNTTDRWVILNGDGEEVGSSETPIELHVTTRGAVIDALKAGDDDVAGRLLHQLLSLLAETVERLVRGEDDFGVRQLVEEVLGDG